MTGDGEELPLIPDPDRDAVSGARGCTGSVCDPRRTLHRYVVLVIMCTISLGSFFCFDNPAALQDHMLSDLDLTESEYMAFYAWYHWTSIAMSLVGGYLIDRIIGSRTGLVLFSVLMALSQALFAMGGLVDAYWEMCLGRALYGVIDGPLGISSNYILIKWYKNKDLFMVMGMRSSMARASSVVNMDVMEPIYNYFSGYFPGHRALGLTLFVGVGVCLVSAFAALVVSHLDKRADRILKKTSSTDKGRREVRLRDIKDFPLTYWLLVATTSLYYCALFPFIALGLVYFEMKYDQEPETADTINGLVYTVAAITMPLCGILMDRTGRNLTWMFIGLSLCTCSHVIFAFTFLTPYVPMIMLGFGYSITTTTMWPLVAFVVDERHLGTAYGIMLAVVSVGQALMNLLAGHIVDTRGYLVLEVVFIAFMCGASFLGCLLYLFDSLRGGKLNRKTSDRSKLYEKETISTSKEQTNIPHT